MRLRRSAKIETVRKAPEGVDDIRTFRPGFAKKSGRRAFGRRLPLPFLFVVVFLVCVALFVPALFGVNAFLDRRVFEGEELDVPDEPPEDELPDDPLLAAFITSDRVNVLLLGVNEELTDTIMFGSYDTERQSADIISIPRDTFYEREEATSAAQRKINAIFRNGKASGTAAAVSDLLAGVPVHHYLTVRYAAVERVVDAVGGVTVSIPFNMTYDDPYDKPPLHIRFEKGERLLSGADAVKYLRFRKNNDGGGYPDQDLGRIKAQQAFMMSAFRKSVGPNLPKVVEAVMANVESDLTVREAGGLALSAVKLDPENIRARTIPGAARTVNGASYYFVDAEQAEALIRELYGVPAETTTDAAITSGGGVTSGAGVTSRPAVTSGGAAGGSR